jgi:hypothetical protein
MDVVARYRHCATGLVLRTDLTPEGFMWQLTDDAHRIGLYPLRQHDGARTQLRYEARMHDARRRVVVSSGVVLLDL